MFCANVMYNRALLGKLRVLACTFSSDRYRYHFHQLSFSSLNCASPRHESNLLYLVRSMPGEFASLCFSSLITARVSESFRILFTGPLTIDYAMGSFVMIVPDAAFIVDLKITLIVLS
jgi:hypothetical protein